jgi:CRISPR-associated protein Cmr4
VNRLVAVSDKLFHHLVNDHLEVRTSVKIDDATGAAEAGALFTYEAIPRGTILRLEIYIDRRRGIDCEPDKIDRMLTHCFTGLKLLGVGGMGTRGFGRLEVLNGVIR